MAAATSPTFDQMMRSVRDGAPSSVYLLHGEESYFIDELVRRFENILPGDKKRGFYEDNQRNRKSIQGA